MATAEEIARAADRKDIRDRWLLSAPALAVIVFASIGPLLIVVVYSLLTSAAYGGVEWKFSPDAWISVFLERDIFDNTLSLADANVTIFWRSIKLAFATTVVTLVLGFPTAYFMATRAEKTRDLWVFLITIPFWTNLLIRTFAVLQIIRNEGFINTLLMKAGVISAPIQILFTDTAILIGMAYVYLPLMVLPIYASMEKLDFRLVEAGYDLYASRWQVLRRIIFPLVKPGVIAGSILVFIPAIGAYVTPSLLGGGKNMMVSNFIELQFGQAHNWPLGSALAITVMVIVMIALLIYVRNAGVSGVRYGS
jgi:spermidine/putrescine transport system permease protein